MRRNHGSFRLHTENEGEFVIVATIKCISPCDNLELSEVSSEFTELEWTVIFGLLVKSDGEAEMAVDTKNVKPKSVIRISLCRTAKRNPLIFPI